VSTLQATYRQLVDSYETITKAREELERHLQPHCDAWATFCYEFEKAQGTGIYQSVWSKTSEVSWPAGNVPGDKRGPWSRTAYELDLEALSAKGYMFSGEDRDGDRLSYVLPYGFVVDQEAYKAACTERWTREIGDQLKVAKDTERERRRQEYERLRQEFGDE
jgi:hypothetical protein